MPYINTTTNVKITEENKNALVKAFAEAIEIIPGKSEQWLMLNFNGESSMAFRGNGSDPLAMLEVEIFGKASNSALERLTSKLCDTVRDILKVSPNRIYVKYREVETWGWNGGNF